MSDMFNKNVRFSPTIKKGTFVLALIKTGFKGFRRVMKKKLSLGYFFSESFFPIDRKKERKKNSV